MMLCYMQAFKSPRIKQAEDVYDLGVLDGLNEQKLL
jgi:hypothetical protein